MEVEIFKIDNKQTKDLINHDVVVFEIKKLEHPTPLDEGNDVEGSNKCMLSSLYKNYMLEIKNFEVYEDDVWLLGYQKCGTTWTQETVWQICNDLQLDAGGKNLLERFPYIERCGLLAESNNTIEQCKNLPRPRLIKSHLPINFLPWQLWTVKPKIIYVMRNPKDVAVSYYHHYKLFDGFKGEKEDFFELFLNGYVDYGDYWSHILQFDKIKNFPNVLTFKYETFKSNTKETLLLIANFLGKSLSEEQIETLQKHLDFKSMKDNKNCNYEDRLKGIEEKIGKKVSFIRRGEADSHKDEMSPEVIKKFDEKASNVFKNCKDLY